MKLTRGVVILLLFALLFSTVVADTGVTTASFSIATPVPSATPEIRTLPTDTPIPVPSEPPAVSPAPESAPESLPEPVKTVIFEKTDIKIASPRKAFDLNLICTGYKSIGKPFSVSVRLQDGTVVGTATVKGTKTKISVSIPDGYAPKADLLLFLDKDDVYSDSRDVAVIDASYKAVTGNYERDDMMVGLTFDCAYGESNTMWLLDTLKKYNAHATFFTVGSWVGNHADPWIKRMLEEGHELGNHTMHHPRLTEKSTGTAIKEINACADTMAAKLNGYTSRLFRPPYGSHNTKLDAVSRYLGYDVIMWALTSGDARDFTAKQMLHRVIDHVKPGDIILMHNGAQELPHYLPAMLEELSKRGYTFGSVSELMNW